MIRKGSKHSRQVQFVWLVILNLLADITFADQPGPNPPQIIEVFTSAKHPIVDTDTNGSGSDWRGLDITVYEIDGIESIERELSFNLPAESQQSKSVALLRLQRLDESTRSRLHSAATGLAKALQYGVEHYPAIVFDGEAVVYGITDLNVALEQYRTWQRGRRP